MFVKYSSSPRLILGITKVYLPNLLILGIYGILRSSEPIFYRSIYVIHKSNSGQKNLETRILSKVVAFYCHFQASNLGLFKF